MTTSTVYRIEIRGRLSDRILGPYALEFVVSRSSSTTVLTGEVRDASHLHGIVSDLTSLGLELVSVAQIPTSGPEPGHDVDESRPLESNERNPP